MNSKGKWFSFIVGALIVIWLLRFPITRAVILWLLPLGSGWDDLVQIVLIILIVFVYATKNIGFGKRVRDRFGMFKDFFRDPEN